MSNQQQGNNGKNNANSPSESSKSGLSETIRSTNSEQLNTPTNAQNISQGGKRPDIKIEVDENDDTGTRASPKQRISPTNLDLSSPNATAQSDQDREAQELIQQLMQEQAQQPMSEQVFFNEQKFI